MKFWMSRLPYHSTYDTNSFEANVDNSSLFIFFNAKNDVTHCKQKVAMGTSD